MHLQLVGWPNEQWILLRISTQSAKQQQEQDLSVSTWACKLVLLTQLNPVNKMDYLVWGLPLTVNNTKLLFPNNSKSITYSYILEDEQQYQHSYNHQFKHMYLVIPPVSSSELQNQSAQQKFSIFGKLQQGQCNITILSQITLDVPAQLNGIYM